MLDYRMHYAIMATEDRLRDAARGRLARRSITQRVVNPSDERRADRSTRR